jgi:hypothetical protein
LLREILGFCDGLGFLVDGGKSDPEGPLTRRDIVGRSGGLVPSGLPFELFAKKEP